MNLRHTISETPETKKQEIPWYKHPETTSEIAESPVKPSVPSPARSTQPTLFEPSETERILARAGALQEIQGERLTQEQIEAIAAEIGIKSEFVHLAIEQEKGNTVTQSGNVTRQRGVTLSKSATKRAKPCIVSPSPAFLPAVIVAYGLLAAILMMAHNGAYPEFAPTIAAVFVLPALLAFTLGAAVQKRRWGAGSGAALAVAVMIAAVISFNPEGKPSPLTAWDIQAIVLMCGSGALLGAAGTQARRIMSRRQTSNRSERVVPKTASTF